jgi:hypothetical protein
MDAMGNNNLPYRVVGPSYRVVGPCRFSIYHARTDNSVWEIEEIIVSAWLNII